MDTDKLNSSEKVLEGLTTKNSPLGYQWRQNGTKPQRLPVLQIAGAPLSTPLAYCE